MPRPELPMIETAPPQEYFFTHFGKIKQAGGDCLRLYCCSEKGNCLEVKFVMVMPMTQIVHCARQAMQAVEEFHNLRTLTADDSRLN